MSSSRAGLHREPLKFHSHQHVKRASGMHLKPYHKVQKKESLLEQRSNKGMHLNNQSSAKEEKRNVATKNLPCTDNPPRRPLGTLSQNTMCNTAGMSSSNSFDVKAKNVPPATIHQGDEGEGTLDSCALIKPGNTKEKIAFFASHHCSNNRNSSMKVKNTGDMSGRAAKRRKKSADLKRMKNHLEKVQEAQKKCLLAESFPSRVEDCSINFVTDGDGILPGRPLSVIEMVEFLEQRASALLSDCAKTFSNSHPSKPTGTLKCALQPISLIALGASENPPEVDNSEKAELDSVCVLEMVAKLESECLRRQNDRESGGLSRNNSFRRNVGRMLLASGSQPGASRAHDDAADPEKDSAASVVDKNGSQNEDHCAPPKPQDSESLPPMEDFFVANVDLELVRETYLKMRCRGDVEITVDPCKLSISVCIKAVECDSFESQTVNDGAPDEKVECSDRIPDPSCKTEDVLMHAQDKALLVDPSPGVLFFKNDENDAKQAHVRINPETKSQAGAPEKHAFDSTLRMQQSSVIAQYAVSISSLGNVTQVLDTSSVKRQVSHDFLETRFKIQQLLEPQQYMAFLPHHILVKIFKYLPTRSLAALKCTSCYFKFIIEHYDIRPCDSLWVRDPRYKDDPCKQCKKKFARGDVSLCLWHPKPYCQALPYGPGFWMCCYMSQKESRGCRVGLHDNRWVPAFYSFNRTVCKKSKESEVEDD
ncbi:F-box only protein 34 [Bufo bufo]|uniref:F-box only protein 34 n=1 Tax=Bufo bufo TaxID=8384 RepID=UPI001ABDCAAA|nr:F-box only protein 34 [Bufo bufo]XP_040267671.1 F-box only protein 34 [Bufo bufo]